MTPLDAEDASTPARCDSTYRVTFGDIHVACQLTIGHAGAHTANCPWDQNSVLIWPAKTSTTCGDV